jgi:Chaperone of endosialidase
MSLYATLSNAFSNVASTDFVIRTIDDTQRLIIGTGFGSNSNACMYIRHNALGINRFPAGGNVLDVIGGLQVDTQSNVNVPRNMNSLMIATSNIVVGSSGSLIATNASISNINTSVINPQGYDVQIGTTACNINIGQKVDGPQTIKIGSSNISNFATINIGSNNDVVNISGLVTNITTPDLKISDKLITLNHGGNDCSDCGFEINENNAVVGYLKTSLDKSSFLFKTPTMGSELVLNLTNNSANFNNNQLFLAANGNIGIGSFLPTSKLTVEGDVSISTSVFANDVVSQFSSIYNLGASNATITQTAACSNITASNATITQINPSRISFQNTETKRKLVIHQTIDNEHQIRSIGSGTNTMNFQIDASTSSFVFATAASPTTSSELMRITGTGSVGIGTTIPVQRLDVRGNISASNTIFTSRLTATNGSNLSIDPGTVGGMVSLCSTNSNGTLNIFDRHGFTKGSIGIGTLTPNNAYVLDVNGSGNFKQIRSAVNDGILNIVGLKKTTGSLGESTLISQNLTYDSNAENFTVISNGTDASFSAIVPSFGKLRCFVGTLAGQSINYTLPANNFLTYEQLTVTPTGTGIGTASPATRLHVNGTGQNAIIRMSGNVANSQGLEIFDTSSRWTIYKPANSTDLRFKSATTDRITINNSGFVGIGTSPSTVLHAYDSGTSVDVLRAENANGSVRYQGDGNLVLYNGFGILTWTAPTNVSDETLKCNIEPITNSLNLINQIEGVYFDFVPEYNIEQGKQIGMIAQDVEKVLPEIVRKDNNTGIYRINYEKITPLLLEGIKELHKIVEKQQGEIEIMKNQIATLLCQ